MSDASVTSEADAVDKAAKWAEALLALVYRGPRDNIDLAIQRAEMMFGIPASTFWSLRYRPPKLMGAWAFYQLKTIYDATCAAQAARANHDLTILKALPRTEARQALIDKAEATLGIAPSRTGTEG